MIHEATDITDDLLALPRRVRASLARSLIASLDDQADENADRAWKKEIRRRYKLFKKNPARGRPIEAVLSDLCAKLQ